jgi:hypothetical protein
MSGATTFGERVYGGKGLICCISFLFINVINLSSINEKGVDPSSYAKSVSW